MVATWFSRAFSTLFVIGTGYRTNKMDPHRKITYPQTRTNRAACSPWQGLRFEWLRRKIWLGERVVVARNGENKSYTHDDDICWIDSDGMQRILYWFCLAFDFFVSHALLSGLVAFSGLAFLFFLSFFKEKLSCSFRPHLGNFYTDPHLYFFSPVRKGTNLFLYFPTENF